MTEHYTLTRCPLCEGTSFEEGIIDETIGVGPTSSRTADIKAAGQSRARIPTRTVRWLKGIRGPNVHEDSRYVRAVRCERCGRLELFAPPD